MANLNEMFKTLKATASLPDDSPMSLPGYFYTTPEFFEFEKNTILHQGWHCIGRADELSKAGDFITTKILNEPLIIARGDDGKIRAMSNVCRHRGMQLMEGSGNTKRFVCSYHAWSYARDGQLVRAANMENANFDIKSCRLPEFSTEIWRGFIYVNLSENPEPLVSQLGLLDDLLSPYETQEFRIVHVAQEQWACNWKCLVENFMEGYHLSVVHPETLRGYTPTELCTKGPSGKGFTSYHANYPDDTPARGHGSHKLTPQQRHRSSLFSIFPIQVASQSASLLVSLALRPVNVERVDVRWTMSVYKDDLDELTIADRIALWAQVNQEDRVKLEKLQVSLASSKAFAGPLASDDFEGTIRDFHKYLAANGNQPNTAH